MKVRTNILRILWGLLTLALVGSLIYFVVMYNRANDRLVVSNTEFTKAVGQYKLKNGKLVSTVEANELTHAQLNLLIDKQKEEYQLLLKKFNKLESTLAIISTTKIDTVYVPFKEVIVTEKPISISGSKLDKYYSFDYKVTNSGFSIQDLTIPDTLFAVAGYKRKWFLGKRTPTIDITNSNKYVIIQQVGFTKVKEDKKFYDTTLFKVGVGLLGGYIISQELK